MTENTLVIASQNGLLPPKEKSIHQRIATAKNATRRITNLSRHERRTFIISSLPLSEMFFFHAKNAGNIIAK
jgi:hypothetical protein